MPRWTLLLLVCFLTSCATRPPALDERQVFGQLGTVTSAVLSRDGTSVAFSAAAPGYTHPQIWIGRADGSAPPRPLTSDSAQNYAPEFSPDGRTIYFTSTREPQGIYQVPASGGDAQLTIANADSPRISPDGNAILYGQGGQLQRRALAGGPQTTVLPAIDNSYAPVWSPDGARILVTTTTKDNREPEWWLAPVAGGEAHKTTLGVDLRAQGFNLIGPNVWLPGDWLVFTGRQGETQTLWKVRLDPSGNPLDKAVRATTDAEGDSAASFSAGKLLFCRTRVDANFWALPLDATGEHTLAAPVPLTSTPERKGGESAAGAKLLYSAENGDRFSLFLKQTPDGTARNLRDGFYSVLSPDGSRYAYGEGVKEQLKVSMKSLRWWSFWSSALCENCGMPRQFSPDGRKLLLWFDEPPMRHIDSLDLATGKISRIVWGAEQFMAPRYSPDGRWISFVAAVGKHRWQGFVAPVVEEKMLSFSDWVPVTSVSNVFFYLFWAQQPDLLYTLSSRGRGGNLRFLDAQRFDPQTRRSTGASLPVYEFDESLVPGMDPVWNNISANGNKIVLELGGITTGIWMK